MKFIMTYHCDKTVRVMIKKKPEWRFPQEEYWKWKVSAVPPWALKILQMENSFDEDELILPHNGKCGGDWRSVGLRGVRSHSKVNLCDKLPVSRTWECADPAATTLAVDTNIDFSLAKN